MVASTNYFPVALFVGLFISQSSAGEMQCVPPSNIMLANGVAMPRVSLGTAGLPRGAGQRTVIQTAIEQGFRAFDTARATEWYDEQSVAQALQESGIPRAEFFVTTKVHPRDLGEASTRRAVQESAAFFNGYVDLVLLHFARCWSGVCSDNETKQADKAGGWKASWRVLQDLLLSGLVRAIGVSNFDLSELMEIEPSPQVVQNWQDPFHQDRETLRWCRTNKVAYTSYSTLGGQWEYKKIENPVLRRLF
jgi:methylglyoxal/glyoxal reductase